MSFALAVAEPDLTVRSVGSDSPRVFDGADDRSAADIGATVVDACSPAQSGSGSDGVPPRKPFTIFGYPVHLAFARTYTAPLDIDWAQHSFAMYYGLLYKDPVIADQFRAFYFRSFLSFCMGSVYGGALLAVAVSPLMTRQFTEVLATASAATVAIMLVDLSMHLFAPVTPTIAKVRMVTSFLIAAVPTFSFGWTQFAVMTECHDSFQLPDFTGRLNVDVEEQRRLCVQMFEPHQIAAMTFGSVGVLVYPIPHALIALLHFLSCFVVARQVATGPFAHEQPGEIAVEAIMLLVSEFGAMAITYVRFSAGRSAFEATIHVEMQRREAAARAAELHKLLHTIVPAAVLPRLEAGGAGQFRIDGVPSASMLFADMKGFTAWSSSRSAEVVTSMLNTVVAALDDLAVRTESVEKVKTIGDAYWAVSGIPVEAQNHADQLVLFGWRMNQIVAELNQVHVEWDDVMWRVGIHSGPMTGALFGDRQVSYEVFGETARIAQVVEAHGVPGSVVVTEQTVAALLLRPEEKYLRAHAVLDGLGPAGGVLTMYEILRPNTDEIETSSSVRRRSTIPVLAIGTASATFGDVTPLSCSVTSPRSPHSVVSGDPLPPRKASRRGSSPYRRGLQVVSHNELGGAAKPAEQFELEECFDDAALEAFEKPRWALLPYYENGDTEALFKARCEVVCRNMSRVCSVFLLCAHLVFMATLVAMPSPCFHPVGVPMQVLALVPFGVAIGCAVHPRGSLQVSMVALLVAATVGLVGTGLTPLNGCEAGRDLSAYVFVVFAAVFFSAGPISWPLLTLMAWFLFTLPTVVFALFFSPAAAGTVILSPMANVMLGMMAFTEERLLRRRFIEEELSKRGEAQLAALGEQRVEVLQRLVPRHIVSDLIAWFGANMDPERSITRSYARVVIAFMQLRPEALDALPRLHAEVDTDLRAICESLQALQLPAAASTLDKIKTVGDLVMVAGPFPDAPPSTAGHPSSTLHVADEELFAAFKATVLLFEAVRAKCPVQVGAHMGPVVGTVQGSSRLAFDVFGDPVNVASRVLTGASTSGSSLHVSGTLAAFVDADGVAGTASAFGSPSSVTAKGKGTLDVLELTKSGWDVAQLTRLPAGGDQSTS